MHSYENGLSLSCKKNNWGQIMKLLNRIEFSYSNEEIDGIIYSNEGYIIPFLTRCYKHLTNRNVSINSIKYGQNTPGYAQNNASTVLHLSMKNGEVAEAKNTEFISVLLLLFIE